MAIVESERRRESAWQDDGQGFQEIRLSKAEYQMILHLRMLSSGVHAVRVRKDARGMRGLREFRIAEIVIPRMRTASPTP